MRYYKEANFGAAAGEARNVATASSRVPVGVSVFRREPYKFPDEYVDLMHLVWEINYVSHLRNSWCGMLQPLIYYKSHEVTLLRTKGTSATRPMMNISLTILTRPSPELLTNDIRRFTEIVIRRDGLLKCTRSPIGANVLYGCVS